MQYGKYTKKTLQSLKTLEELGEIVERVSASVGRIGGKMESGIMHATPLKEKNGKAKACEYCPYKSICRNPQLDAQD
jgi:ATP-dependent helicase/DNAse subunit B